LLACLAAALLAACGPSADPAPPESPRPATSVTPTATASPAQGEGATFLAVGDIGDCGSMGDEAVAALAASLPGPIAAVGDLAYEQGTASDFARCFDPAWGPLKARLHPAAGNREYGTGLADAYFAYFEGAAGTPGEGYYSYDVGTWHVVVLNSNCDFVPGGCGRDSAQYRWLKSELEAHPAACTLAYWHHPRFTSGLHGNTEAMADTWTLLYSEGADVVISGHDHHYERFAPLDAEGAVDQTHGIREFIVGTGGATLFPVFRVAPGSEVRDLQTFGLLQLTLREGSYDWTFRPVAGGTFTDSGNGTCH
jgi:hypothetical protein